MPTRNAIHDKTKQDRVFGYVSDIGSDSSRVSLFGGTSICTFQIPPERLSLAQICRAVTNY